MARHAQAIGEDHHQGNPTCWSHAYLIAKIKTTKSLGRCVGVLPALYYLLSLPYLSTNRTNHCEIWASLSGTVKVSILMDCYTCCWVVVRGFPKRSYCLHLQRAASSHKTWIFSNTIIITSNFIMQSAVSEPLGHDYRGVYNRLWELTL
jgi:hypothetical protein